MIVSYEKYLLEDLLNETLLNEEINFDKIKNMINKINNKKEMIQNIIEKFNKAKNVKTKKYLATILVLLVLSGVAIKNIRRIKSDIDSVTTELINKEKIDVTDIVDISKPLVINGHLQSSNIYGYKLHAPFIDIEKAKTSDSTRLMIKDHEKLRLVAYDLGDGQITVGYGHAKPKELSFYRVGDVITEKLADILFDRDIRDAEDAVRRMIDDWDEDGHHVELTQGMFDAIVSMMFNMGVRGFRNTPVVYYLKKSDYIGAAEAIRRSGVSDDYPGLYGRRESEYKLFVKDLS